MTYRSAIAQHLLRPVENVRRDIFPSHHVSDVRADAAGVPCVRDESLLYTIHPQDQVQCRYEEHDAGYADHNLEWMLAR